MDAKNVASFAITFLTGLPGLIAAGIDVAGTIAQHVSALKKMKDENRDPTPEEWSALNLQLSRDAGRLQGAHADGK